jgi:hypothetical protein
MPDAKISTQTGITWCAACKYKPDAPDGGSFSEKSASSSSRAAFVGRNKTLCQEASVAGNIVDSYQGPKWNSAKMFLVTRPDGERIEYRHPLDRGEFFNNSFVTASPDRQWIVSGEFGTQKRLQVFPAPLLNRSTPPNGGELPQAGQINLSRPVKNIGAAQDK